MSTYSAKALVLRKTSLRESDQIFSLLLEDGSKTEAVARGILKPKAKMGGVLRPFTTADLLLAHGKSLDTVCEAKALEVPQGCEADVEHLCASNCVCELVCRLALPHQVQPRLFDLVCAALRSISTSRTEQLALVSAAALVKVVCIMGYRPSLEHCISCGAQVEDAGDERGQCAFSWRDGGVMCRDCAAKALGHQSLSVSTISWMRALIGSTFAQILALDGDAWAFGRNALDFCDRWIREHTELNVKSLSMMFDLVA